MNPRVSVIIPYYEGEQWLPSSAASVLRQDGVELELIVVDDGSVSSAETVVDSPHDGRVRLLRIDHSGKGAAVNSGIKEARGEIVCVLDQDDLMVDGRLSRQIMALDEHPEVEVVYSDYERITERGERIDIFVSRQASNREMLHAMACGAGLISMQTMIIRKATLERLGGFSEDFSLTGLDDGEFFARLMGSGARLLYVPGIAGRWVCHEKNYSKSPEFQDARLRFLDRLEALREKYPLISQELKFFQAHNYFMRGVYFLERGIPRHAVKEFAKAVYACPFKLNLYYLLLKASLLALIKPLFPEQSGEKK